MRDYENVLLISENILKTYGLINDNIDSCYLMPAMVLAQQIGLQELLGTKLLSKLQTLIKNNDIELEANANYKTLLDSYCIPYLVWQTMAEILVPISFKTANSGSFLSQDEHKQAATIEDVQYLKEYYTDKARFFAKLLTDYILVNAVKYPEWPGSFTDGLVGLTESYSGVYFKDYPYSRRRFRYDDKNYPCY